MLKQLVVRVDDRTNEKLEEIAGEEGRLISEVMDRLDELKTRALKTDKSART